MSLRSRLLLAVGVVACIALIVADLVTYSSLRSFLVNRIDQTLETTLGPTGTGARPPGSEGLVPPVNANELGGRTALGSGDQPNGGSALNTRAPGTFVEIRTKSGRVLVRHAAPTAGGSIYSPALPAPLPTPRRTGELTYFTTASTKPHGPPFRVQVARTPDGRTIILGLPLDTVAATLHQLLVIELAVTAAALVAALLLGAWLVRVGLRPLEDVEETAEAIAAGDLDRRVPGDNARTEVGRLARVLNVMLSRISEAFAERRATEARLRRSEERMRRFIADASHELRTPLTAVGAYAELFSRGAAEHPEDLERVMRGIQDESARMARLVEDLFLLARLDEGQSIAIEPVDLDELAADAVTAARTIDPRWPVDLQAPETVRVTGDPIRLRQVVDNLMTNVRVHTPPGTAATVTVAQDGSDAVLRVTDDGPGFPPEVSDQLFERFFRTDASRARAHPDDQQYGGTGLGLAIVSAIMEAHHGHVTTTSEPGQGATFTVTLPLLDSAGPPDEPGPQDEPGPPDEPGPLDEPGQQDEPGPPDERAQPDEPTTHVRPG